MCTACTSLWLLHVVEVSRLELRRETNVRRADGLFYVYPLVLRWCYVGVTLVLLKLYMVYHYVQSVGACYAITMVGSLVNEEL